MSSEAELTDAELQAMLQRAKEKLDKLRERQAQTQAALRWALHFVPENACTCPAVDQRNNARIHWEDCPHTSALALSKSEPAPEADEE